MPEPCPRPSCTEGARVPTKPKSIHVCACARARVRLCGACVCARTRMCGGGGLCARGQGSALRVAARLTKRLGAGRRSAVVVDSLRGLLGSGGYLSRRKTLELPDPSLAARAPRSPLGLPSPHERAARARRRPDTSFGPLSLGSSFVPSKGINPEERALRGTAQRSVAW